LTIDQPVARLERQIRRGFLFLTCVNPQTGQDETCRWTTWDGPTTNGTSIPYQHTLSGQINPAVAYANWPTGDYQVAVRGVSPDNLIGLMKTVDFSIINPLPTLYTFHFNPASIDQRQSSPITVSYDIHTSMPVRFERIIENTDSHQCFNNDAQVVACQWASWNALSTSNTSAPYTYGLSVTLTPSTAYANWQTGAYRIRVRGINSDNVISNELSANFEIIKSPPAITDFWLSPASFGKSNNNLVQATYTMTSTAPVNAMQRKITRNGICINPATGQTSGQCWYDWTVLTTGSTTNPYQYVFGIELNPALSYVNWQTGSYVLEVHGSAEGYTVSRSLNFSVTP
jgi:hypothetical protein